MAAKERDYHAEMTVRAREIVEKQPDPARATRKLMREINGDPKWRAGLLEPLCMSAVAVAIAQARHRQRNGLKSEARAFADSEGIPPAYGLPGHFEGDRREIARVEKERTERLLAQWYIGDKPLGDCTGAEVRAEMGRDAAKSAGYVRNVQFYGLLLERVDDGQLVRDAWTDDDAEAVLGSVTAGQEEAA